VGEFHIINSMQVKAFMNMAELIPEIEKAYRYKARNEGGVFPVITHEWIVGSKDMDIKSGYIDGDVKIYGLKALTYIEENQKRGLPCLTGTMMVFNSQTGQLKGVLDSGHITGFRTGAAGAIGSKYLARPDSKNLLLVGAGKQALFNLAGNLLVMEGLERVMVCDPANPQGAAGFIHGLKERLWDEIFSVAAPNQKEKLNFNCQAVPMEELEAAAMAADIIVTTTPSRNPILKDKWISEGVHINCIGADMEGKEEIEKEIFARARIVVDDITQAISIGETEIPVKQGVISREDIVCEIGQLIEGGAKGRCSDKDITIFDTTGLALQDLITAEYLIRKAEEAGQEKFKI